MEQAKNQNKVMSLRLSSKKLHNKEAIEKRPRNLPYAWGLVEGSALVGLLGIFLTLSIVSRVSDAARGTRIWSREQKGLFVRRRPQRHERCLKCGGFGIIRCTLCAGRGFVRYEKKLQHSDPCPLCTARRYVRCGICGGNGRRKLVRRHNPALSSLDLRNPSSVYYAFKIWREEFVQRGSLSVGWMNHEGIFNRVFRVAATLSESLQTAIGRQWQSLRNRVQVGIEEYRAARRTARMGRFARVRRVVEERLQKQSR
ncbi:hypothetical protein CCYA_CCYA15G3956 [Cyanidiococcus yangmingshanensis]|nr:hypothetical protein CCYA_CCYA15G3956 [Cyanidiococcus yangmingshanensis]